MNDDRALSAPAPEGEPWWCFPLVWLVVALPAAVVVAGFTTLWLALRSPDPVVTTDYYRQGLELARDPGGKKLMPAMAGRNHAATPADDLRAPRR
ncbi:FixH family protein [Variovorax sp. JS1663]|uniref:FixH family protein n=1 Tax=Variovorax sp. JS1663 TaxID=1851577 RepID=UPI000B342ADB|nr:FixH family protein [Variovorax sp. JS1663]OUM00945.1 nitrogen fixation protein FixH [Variovorax sp. JS1663]